MLLDLFLPKYMKFEARFQILSTIFTNYLMLVFSQTDFRSKFKQPEQK